MLQILYSNPITFVLALLSLVLSIAIHEFSHAFVAMKLGDFTAKSLGRLTLNPLAHIDGLGLALLVFFGFGWGKPVPVNYYNLKNPKRDSALISIAGPVSNLMLAAFLALLLRIFPFGTILSAFFYILISYNVLLAIFNLLPIHPLDGFKVVYGLLPPSLALQWMEIERFGPVILLFILVTGSVSTVLIPIVTVIMRFLGLSY
ncbi:hypothetical protein A3K42_01005 [candidate division WWE3 bacterium RBG_13_37_7]|uniref:Peptidase M50 domain-containing protein n=1 Tax=candidate division WWE3 bacterium RBG_13_37_7 TaxID=1802609 RepID=A0A1F4U0E2_UNCKA|nr:MAG: hypothetical protein A3K42_01005 [candidate division WWE3 bacterium RBG_13_37_7]